MSVTVQEIKEDDVHYFSPNSDETLHILWDGGLVWKSAGQVITSFRAEQPILQVVWACFFNFLSGCHERSLCLLHPNKVMVYLPRAGDIYSVAMPCRVKKLWALLEGVLVEGLPADTALSEGPPGEVPPRLFSLLHPLEELKPLALFDAEEAAASTRPTDVLSDFVTDPAIRVVFTSPHLPLLLTYHCTKLRHSLYIIRQSRSEVAKRLQMGLQHGDAAAGDPPDLTTLSAHDSPARTTSLQGSPDSTHSGEDLPHRIHSELFLECVWRQDFVSPQCSSVFLACEKNHIPLICIFEASNCHLVVFRLRPHESQLSLVPAFELKVKAAVPIRSCWNNLLNFRAITATTSSQPPGRGAGVAGHEGPASLEPFNYDMLVLEMDGRLALYSGSERISTVALNILPVSPKLEADRMDPVEGEKSLFSESVINSPPLNLSPIPARETFGSPFAPSTTPKTTDDIADESFEEGAFDAEIVDLKDVVGGSVTLVTGDDRMLRATLPESFRSPLVIACLRALLSAKSPPKLLQWLRIQLLRFHDCSQQGQSAPVTEWRTFAELCIQAISGQMDPTEEKATSEGSADAASDLPVGDSAWLQLLQSDYHRHVASCRLAGPAALATELEAAWASSATQPFSPSPTSYSPPGKRRKTGPKVVQDQAPESSKLVLAQQEATRLLETLHMLYECFKLNTLEHAWLLPLGILNHTMAKQLRLPQYEDHYWRDLGPVLLDTVVGSETFHVGSASAMQDGAAARRRKVTGKGKGKGKPGEAEVENVNDSQAESFEIFDVYSWVADSLTCDNGGESVELPFPPIFPFGHCVGKFLEVLSASKSTALQPAEPAAALAVPSSLDRPDRTPRQAGRPGSKRLGVPMFPPTLPAASPLGFQSPLMPYLKRSADEPSSGKQSAGRPRVQLEARQNAFPLFSPSAWHSSSPKPTTKPIPARPGPAENTEPGAAGSTCIQLVDAMTAEGFGLADVGRLPLGVAWPLLEVLNRLRADPPRDASPEVYRLLAREDMAWIAEHQTPPPYWDRTPGRAVEWMAKGDGSLASSMSLNDRLEAKHGNNIALSGDDEVDKQGSGASDGTLLVQEQNAWVFPEDLRLREATRLLRSDRLLCVALSKAVLAETEHDVNLLTAKQQKRLQYLAVRALGLPVGRGMFTLASINPILTEGLPIPGFNLNGRVPPKNHDIEIDLSEFPANFMDWPQFHNGVASGLRVAPGQSQISRYWILYNQPAELTFSHAGFLFGLGLQGHLNSLKPPDFYRYLSKKHEPTTMGVLLGISAARRGSMDPTVSTMLCLHHPALLPPGFQEMEIPSLIQTSALIGLGLLYQGSAHRLMTEVLLMEISKRTMSDKDTDREGYSLAAGLSLGLVVLGRGKDTAGLSDLRLEDQLAAFIDGGRLGTASSENRSFGMMGDPQRSAHGGLFDEPAIQRQTAESSRIREGEYVNLDLTAPGATLALGMMFMKSNNASVAARLRIPDTAFLLDYVRPDFLLLRVLSQGLILWDAVAPTWVWVESHLSPLLLKNARLFLPPATNENPSVDRDIKSLETKEKVEESPPSASPSVDDGSETFLDFELMRQSYCNVVAGACLALGLRFAGSSDKRTAEVLRFYVTSLCDVRRRKGALRGTDHARLDRSTLDNCLCLCALSLALVMAGTGDLPTFQLLRAIRCTRDPKITYGHHMATHMAIGFLFLGGCRCSLSNSCESIAALICSLFPRFPLNTSDNRYHLQALRHMYTLAVENRALSVRDVNSRSALRVPVKCWLRSEQGPKPLNLVSPCLLPPLEEIYKIELDCKGYWPLIISRQHEVLFKVEGVPSDRLPFPYGDIFIKAREDEPVEMAGNVSVGELASTEPLSRDLISTRRHGPFSKLATMAMAPLDRAIAHWHQNLHIHDVCGNLALKSFQLARVFSSSRESLHLQAGPVTQTQQAAAVLDKMVFMARHMDIAQVCEHEAAALGKRHVLRLLDQYYSTCLGEIIAEQKAVVASTTSRKAIEVEASPPRTRGYHKRKKAALVSNGTSCESKTKPNLLTAARFSEVHDNAKHSPLLACILVAGGFPSPQELHSILLRFQALLKFLGWAPLLTLLRQCNTLQAESKSSGPPKSIEALIPLIALCFSSDNPNPGTRVPAWTCLRLLEVLTHRALLSSPSE
eukprot:g71415.t1